MGFLSFWCILRSLKHSVLYDFSSIHDISNNVLLSSVWLIDELL